MNIFVCWIWNQHSDHYSNISHDWLRSLFESCRLTNLPPPNQPNETIYAHSQSPFTQCLISMQITSIVDVWLMTCLSQFSSSHPMCFLTVLVCTVQVQKSPLVWKSQSAVSIPYQCLSEIKKQISTTLDYTWPVIIIWIASVHPGPLARTGQLIMSRHSLLTVDSLLIVDHDTLKYLM